MNENNNIELLMVTEDNYKDQKQKTKKFIYKGLTFNNIKLKEHLTILIRYRHLMNIKHMCLILNSMYTFLMLYNNKWLRSKNLSLLTLHKLFLTMSKS